MSAAERVRRHRQRQAQGRIVIPVEADEVALVERLVGAGFLRPELADNPTAIRRALERLVESLVVTSM